MAVLFDRGARRGPRTEHILVVEDEPVVARDIEDSLHSAGYAVAAVASSGEEALSKIPLTQPIGSSWTSS